MDKQFRNPLIKQTKKEFIELYNTLKLKTNHILPHLQQYQYLKFYSNENQEEILNDTNSENQLVKIFDEIVVYLRTEDYIKVILHYSKPFQKISKDIQKKWAEIFDLIKTYHEDETKSINLVPSWLNSDEKLSIDNFYIPLEMKKIVSENKSLILSDFEFFDSLANDETPNLIIGDSQTGKSMQINRILHLWSFKKTILQKHLLLKLDFEYYDKKISFEENLYKQNIPNNSDLSFDIFQFFVLFDQNERCILLIDNIEYILYDGLNEKIFQNIISKNHKMIVKRIWSRKLQIIRYQNNFSSIYKITKIDNFALIDQMLTEENLNLEFHESIQKMIKSDRNCFGKLVFFIILFLEKKKQQEREDDNEYLLSLVLKNQQKFSKPLNKDQYNILSNVRFLLFEKCGQPKFIELLEIDWFIPENYLNTNGFFKPSEELLQLTKIKGNIQNNNFDVIYFFKIGEISNPYYKHNEERIKFFAKTKTIMNILTLFTIKEIENLTMSDFIKYYEQDFQNVYTENFVNGLQALFLYKKSKRKLLIINLFDSHLNVMKSNFLKKLFLGLSANKLSSVNYLSLRRFGINENSGISLPGFLKQQRNLSFLDLSCNKIENKLARQIIHGLSFNSSSLTHISFKNIGIDKKIGSSLADFFQKQHELEFLDLSNNKLENEIAKQIFQVLSANCFSLSRIHLKNIGIDENIGSSLPDLFKKRQNLIGFDLSYNKIRNEVANQIFENLSSNHTNLEVMSLRSIGMDQNLGTLLPDLLKKQHYLSYLDISNNRIGNKLAKKIFEAFSVNCLSLKEIRLKNISIDQNIGNSLSRILKQPKNLSILELSSNIIGNKIAKEIFIILSENCSSFEKLLLDGIGIDMNISNSLTDFLKRQKNLSALDLSKNKIGNEKANQIFQALSENCSSLKHIHLKDIGINQNVGSFLVNFLNKQSTLSVLNLSHNKLGNELIQQIFNKLMTSSILPNEIYLDKTKIDWRVCTSLQDLFKRHRNLCILDLSNNEIGNEAIIQIIATLSDNCLSFKRIYLRDIGVDENIDLSILDSLKRLQNLSVLDLSKNQLGVKVAQTIYQELTTNCSFLNEIYLDEIRMKPKVTDTLRDAPQEQQISPIFYLS